MRTPLAALQLQTQALLRSAQRGAPLTGDSLEHRLTKMLGSTQRLARLVDDLLDVSRISAGKLILQPEELDLVALCQEVVARHSEQALRLGSQVVFRGPDRLVGRWDRMGLDHALSNLVGNGLKYGGRHPVEVELKVVGDSAQVSVRDHGIGVDAANHERIFERFERAVNDSHYGGLGLGLWIVRQVVEASGGTVEIESEVGQGATFTVTLPMQMSEGADEPEASRAGAAPSHRPPMLTDPQR
jgi:signal transduction histidine kinase